MQQGNSESMVPRGVRDFDWLTAEAKSSGGVLLSLEVSMYREPKWTHLRKKKTKNREWVQSVPFSMGTDWDQSRGKSRKRRIRKHLQSKEGRRAKGGAGEHPNLKINVSFADTRLKKKRSKLMRGSTHNPREERKEGESKGELTWDWKPEHEVGGKLFWNRNSSGWE